MSQNTEEKTVEQIVQEFEREEGVQSAPVTDSQSVVSNIEEIICTETLPEEPKVEVDDKNIEIIDLTQEVNSWSVGDKNNIKSEIIDLTKEDDSLTVDEKNNNNSEPQSPILLRHTDSFSYREAANQRHRLIMDTWMKQTEFEEDQDLLEDNPDLSDMEEALKIMEQDEIETVDSTLEELMEREEDRQDDLQEERNDPERDRDWELGIVNRCPAPNRRKRWWKYTGFCLETLKDQPYDKQVSWITESIFQKIRHMKGLNFCILGIEVCPETERVHCHALLYFDSDKRFNTLRTELPIGQWQWLDNNRGGSISQAILNWYRYVIKSRTKRNTGKEILKWEREPGTIDRMMANPGKRTFSEQFADNYQQIMDRDWQNVEREFLFQHANKIGNFLKLFPQPGVAAKHDKLVFVWGPTRVGKSSLFKRWIPSRNYYQKTPGNRWFDGYDRQPVIIIDEVTPRNFQADGMSWNDWGDRYSITAEVKHGTCNLCNEWLIVISNYSLRELCTRGNRFDATLYETFKSRCGDRELNFFRINKINGHMKGDKMISEYDYNAPRHVKMMIQRIFGPWANDMLIYYLPEVAICELFPGEHL